MIVSFFDSALLEVSRRNLYLKKEKKEKKKRKNPFKKKQKKNKKKNTYIAPILRCRTGS
jgi:hypothetical protein